MPTLILYATKYGATRTVAERLAALLPGKAELFDLSAGAAEPDLAPYDTVVVGTSVYMSKPRKEVKRFCEKNESVLLSKKLGLFLCCIQDLENTVETQLSVTFSKALRAHAVALGALGGRVEYDKLRGMDKPIMKMIAGSLQKQTGKNVFDTISDDRIRQFARNLTK